MDPVNIPAKLELEIIGGAEKNSAVPGYVNAPFSPKFLKGFCWDKPCEYTCHI